MLLFNYLSILNKFSLYLKFYMRATLWFARVSLLIVYFWFGFLKVVGYSPAEPLVNQLFKITLVSFFSFRSFVILFGLFECFIGLLWALPKLTKHAFYLVCIHLLLTTLPLMLLTETTWSSFLIPTLIGQYIIKNLLLLSNAIFILNNRKFILK